MEQYDKNGNKLYEHPPDSPYHGLSLAEQKMLAKLRRGNKKTPKAISRMWKKADCHVYASILKHCISTLVQAHDADAFRLDRVRVILKLPYNYLRFAKEGFPRPVFLGYEDWYVYCQFTVDSIVNYLHSIGESSYDARQLRKEIWAIKRDMDRLLWLHTYAIDVCFSEELDEIIPRAKEERAAMRKDRKRAIKFIDNKNMKGRTKETTTIDNPTHT